MRMIVMVNDKMRYTKRKKSSDFKQGVIESYRYNEYGGRVVEKL